MVVKVFGIDPYATPAVVAYRQVAFSSVLKLSVVCVVPAASAPLGCPLMRTGGVVSAGAPVCVIRRTVPPLKST